MYVKYLLNFSLEAFKGISVFQLIILPYIITCSNCIVF